MLSMHLVKAALLTVTATSDHKFVTVPAGVKIECSDNLAEPGFVHITFDGTDLLAFTRDIHERTETVKRDHRAPSTQ